MEKIIINRGWVFYEFIYALLIAIGALSLDEEVGLSIAIIIIGAALFLGYLVFFPSCYRLSEKSVAVYYAFCIKTEALWSEIRYVEDHYNRRSIFPWARVYHIRYFKAQLPIWEEALIPKNRKTTVLIEKYYKNKIKKYG